MASVIVGGLHKAQEAVQKATSKERKVVDLERDTANIHTKQPLTTDHGVRVENTDQWLRVVDDQHTGPSLLEDQIAREKVRQFSSLLHFLYIFIRSTAICLLSSSIISTLTSIQITRFDHERIPERVVHARGTGAFGNFKLTQSIEDLTYAGVLTDTSRNTPMFVRFSTVQGSRGSADTVRDVRGFATKFYTDEGIWDLVGNNIPVFFIQDAIKFPDFG